MQAWRLHNYGGPEVIQLDHIPVPQPTDGQIQVAVNKAGICPFDWKVREGYLKDHMPLSLPCTLGTDFLGTVTAVGKGLQGFKIGDRVMGFEQSLGSFAEYRIVSDTKVLAHVPQGLSNDQAMTLPMNAQTAWEALHAAGSLEKGMRVLVQGGSGNVGAFAIQLAKTAGCYVFATGSATNKDYILGLGADVFIDYKKEKFEDVVQDADLVVDCIHIGGVDDTTARSWQVLKKGGAVVSVADPHVFDQVPAGKRAFFFSTTPNGSQLEMLSVMLRDGKIKGKVAKVFGKDQLPEAMELCKNTGATGRILVDFGKA